MVATLERVLLVCAVHFVVIRAAFRDKSLFYVHITIESDVSGAIL